MEKYQNGAKLAEMDLSLRGPGQIYGQLQHGRDFFKIAAFDDYSLIKQTKSDTQKLINTDMDLAKHPLLKDRFLSGKITDIAPD